MEKLLDKEFEVLRVVKDHQNVAKIYALQKRKVYGGWEGRELMEYCPIGLFDYLKALEKDKKFIPEDEIWEMMYDLVSALGFNGVGGISIPVGGVTISLSGLAIAALVGIVMNAVLPGKDYEFGTNEQGDTSVNFGTRAK